MTKEELQKARDEKTWLVFNDEVLIRADSLAMSSWLAWDTTVRAGLNRGPFRRFRLATPNDMLKYEVSELEYRAKS